MAYEDYEWYLKNQIWPEKKYLQVIKYTYAVTYVRYTFEKKGKEENHKYL